MTINFQMENCDKFHIFVKNIANGYLLESPREAVGKFSKNLCF